MNSYTARGLLRRAGLVAVGAAPLVFFLLLLPPDRPTGGTDDLPGPATTSTFVGEEIPLEFPFLAAPSPAPSAEVPSPVPSASSRPAPSTTRPEGAATTTTTRPAQPVSTLAELEPGAPAPTRFGPPPPACANGVDDDGDGGADLGDPGCSSAGDHSESDNPQCSDGLDDDGDGTVDSGDPGCSSPRDADESDDNITSTDNGQGAPQGPDGPPGVSNFNMEGLPP